MNGEQERQDPLEEGKWVWNRLPLDRWAWPLSFFLQEPASSSVLMAGTKEYVFA